MLGGSIHRKPDDSHEVPPPPHTGTSAVSSFGLAGHPAGPHEVPLQRHTHTHAYFKIQVLPFSPFPLKSHSAHRIVVHGHRFQ
jgi:hypothetical protein